MIDRQVYIDEFARRNVRISSTSIETSKKESISKFERVVITFHYSEDRSRTSDLSIIDNSLHYYGIYLDGEEDFFDLEIYSHSYETIRNLARRLAEFYDFDLYENNEKSQVTLQNEDLSKFYFERVAYEDNSEAFNIESSSFEIASNDSSDLTLIRPYNFPLKQKLFYIISAIVILGGPILKAIYYDSSSDNYLSSLGLLLVGLFISTIFLTLLRDDYKKIVIHFKEDEIKIYDFHNRFFKPITHRFNLSLIRNISFHKKLEKITETNASYINEKFGGLFISLDNMYVQLFSGINVYDSYLLYSLFLKQAKEVNSSIANQKVSA